jgi:hypothetical protein
MGAEIRSLTKSPAHETSLNAIERKLPPTKSKSPGDSLQPLRLDLPEARYAFLTGCVLMVERGEDLPPAVMDWVVRELGTPGRR